MTNNRPSGVRRLYTLSLSFACSMLGMFSSADCAWARTHHKSHSSSHHSHASDDSGTTSSAGSRHGRHRGRHHGKPVAVTTKHAYPLDFFMMHPPEIDRSELSPEMAAKVRDTFQTGVADNYNTNYLIRAGAVKYHPIRGGIYKRREDVKYIVVHSTESGVPQDAVHVIEAWSSMGQRHPGAQFVVDRDGTIWNACDPDLATVHVNIFKTLPGINNDNTVGIEMCHAGSQTYTPEQKASVIRLVSYLQDRYHVLYENIITHRYAQQGDHTDPVNFDWDGFLAQESDFHNKALAMKRELGPPTSEEIAQGPEFPTASVYLEMHRTLRPEDVLNRTALKRTEILKAQREAELMTTVTPVGGWSYAAKVAAPASAKDPMSAAATPIPLAGAGKKLPIRGELELPPDTARSSDKTAN